MTLLSYKYNKYQENIFIVHCFRAVFPGQIFLGHPLLAHLQNAARTCFPIFDFDFKTVQQVSYVLCEACTRLSQECWFCPRRLNLQNLRLPSKSTCLQTALLFADTAHIASSAFYQPRVKAPGLYVHGNLNEKLVKIRNLTKMR